MKIAWIGTGVMGSYMARHIKQEGHEVSAYNRTKEKAVALEKDGIPACDTIQDCVKDADVVFTIVGYPKDVEEVYCKQDGIFAHCKKGCICVDMTTSSPSLAKKLYELGKKKGIDVLDAPVSGGDSGAKAGTLSIMAGGEKAVFERVKALFDTMGTALWMGEAGCGQHTKACNQICVAGAVAAMSEAIHYARVNGLDEEKMLAAISKGAAGSWQINNTAPRVLQKDFAPGFYIKHFIKDMRIVQDVMSEHKEHLDMLDAVCKEYEALAEQGHENEGTQALIKYYEK